MYVCMCEAIELDVGSECSIPGGRVSWTNKVVMVGGLMKVRPTISIVLIVEK